MSILDAPVTSATVASPTGTAARTGVSRIRVASPALERRETNFDLLRLVAASCVLLGHSLLFLRPSWLEAHPSSWWAQIALDAVDIFFVISGYLVVRSWLRDPHVARYLARRLLRLMPALLVLLPVTLLAGALLTTLPPLTYLRQPGTWAYLLNGTLFARVDQLSGVFLHNHYRIAVDQQLWTLPYEFACYLAVVVVAYAGMYLTGRRLRMIVVAISLAALAVLAIGQIGVGWSFHIGSAHVSLGFWGPDLGRLAGFFIAGVLFSRWERAIPLRPAPAAICAAVFLLSSQIVWLFPISAVSLVYAVMYFAKGAPPVLSCVTRHGDFSYGIYIYGFFIQQMLAAALEGIRSPMLLFIISWPCTLLVAMASWHLVEKRALRLKPPATHVSTPEPLGALQAGELSTAGTVATA